MLKWISSWVECRILLFYLFQKSEYRIRVKHSWHTFTQLVSGYQKIEWILFL